MLRLGFLAFSLTSTTRNLLTAFGRHAPDVTVELRQHEWDDPSAGLLAGTTDAAFVRLPFTRSDTLDTLVLDVEPVLAMADAPGYALALAWRRSDPAPSAHELVRFASRHRS